MLKPPGMILLRCSTPPRAHPAIFPHIRQDALSRRIAAGQCIYEDAVAITYQQYKKRTRVGDVDVPRGAVTLHQIVNSKQFSGSADLCGEQQRGGWLQRPEMDCRERHD
jgi:hypothetical protein